jgi:cyclomaltodextrinase
MPALQVRLAALLIVLSLVPAARAADVWRLAGTFNGWNTNDPAWAMSPDPDAPGAFALERTLEPGSYVFKFVRNGSWGAGHLGLAPDGGLEQPGADLVLDIPARATFRFTLDPDAAEWTFGPVDLEAPILVTKVRGVPVLQAPILIDCTDTLTNNPHDQCAMLVWGDKGVLRTKPSVDGTLRWIVFPQLTGERELNVQVVDGEGGARAIGTITIDVLDRHMYHLKVKDDPLMQSTVARRFSLISPVAPGIMRAIIEVDEPVEVEEFSVSRNNTDHIYDRSFTLEPGTWCVEVVDGVVTQHAGVPGHHRLLAPGNWTRFKYTAPDPLNPPDEVHVVGDFNGWAMPGEAGSTPMSPLFDSRFTTVFDLADGVYTYRLLVDGDEWATEDDRPTAILPDGRRVSVLVIGPWGDGLPEARDDHVLASAVFHDPLLPRDLRTVSRDLGLADVAVLTLGGDAESVTLNLEGPDGGAVAMRRAADLAGFDLWTARVMTGSPELRYSFTVTDGSDAHTTETFEATLEPDPLQTPAWAMGAVWYQIFPERFRNGNPLNDPSGGSIYAMPWNAHWYESTDEEKAAHRERYGIDPGEALEPQYVHDNLYHWVFDRRYGGDLQGVVEKLDYIRDLGVTAIYFNPVFEADSMHKYDATDFRHIDDNFGTPASEGRTPESFEAPTGEWSDPATWSWTAADRYFLDVLLPEAKKRGIRVIIDAVYNHTGRPHFAFQDVMEHGADSEFADWYYVEFDDDGNLESWTAWDGPSGWLPKFKQTPDGNLVQPVKDHLFAVTERWMDPNGDGDPSDGVDGWRLDVPLDIGEAQGAPFWTDWRRHVKRINPDAIIIAEIWDEANEWLQGDHFDTHMHYPFAIAVTEWLAVKPGMSSQALGSELNEAFNEAPQTNLIHQNLFTSHDSDRYVSKLLNPGREYDAGNRPQDGGDNLNYVDVKPPKEIYDLSLVGVAIQATYRGAPMIYYGAEVGMWGADDPTDRKPYPWPDTGPMVNPDDEIVPGILEEYQRWFALRHDETLGPILRYGATQHLDSGDPDVFAFVRSLNGTQVYVVANKGRGSFNASELVPTSRRDTIVEPVSTRYWVVGD